MIGVILISHGEMAKGMKDALGMFFGSQLEAVEVVSLTPEKSSDTFYEELQEARERVDRNNGVVIFADLFGGTPFNQASRIMDDSCCVIAGMNLSMLMEFFVIRDNAKSLAEIPFEEILNAGREGIRYTKEVQMNQDNEEL